MGAAETGLALFKTVEIAILHHIAQIRHSAPGITLSFNDRRENGCQSNDAEREKWKFHLLPHIRCWITNAAVLSCPYAASDNKDRSRATIAPTKGDQTYLAAGHLRVATVRSNRVVGRRN